MSMNQSSGRRERRPSKRLRIRSLKNVEFQKSANSDFQVPYIAGEQIYRVNIIGTITSKSKENNLVNYIIDDGSWSIIIKTADQDFTDFSVWEDVDIVGKVNARMKEDRTVESAFIEPEIMTPIDNMNWELVHRIEIIRARKEGIMATEQEFKESSGVSKEETATGDDVTGDTESDLEQQLIKYFKDHEPGAKINFRDIHKKFSNFDEEELNDALTNLLSEGNIYEPTAGVFKFIG